MTKAAQTIEAVATEQKEMKAKHGEILARLQETEQKLARDDGYGAAAPTNAGRMQFKSITESESFEHFRQRRMDRSERYSLPLSIKALLTDTGDPDTANGLYPGRVERLPGLHGYAMRPLRLLDVLTAVPQTTGTFEYVRISASGGAEVQDGEGDEKAPMRFDGELVTGRVATIAVHTTCSAQVLDDDTQLQAELSRILAHSVVAKIEQQLIVGSGTGLHIEGLHTAATAIATSPDSIVDRLGTAIVAMETDGHSPNVILLNPTDWFTVQTMKSADARYLFGNPAAPAAPTLWNRAIITNPNVPAGTAVIGDTAQTEVRDRMQPTVFLSRDHLDYRTRNLVLILVEARLGLAIFNESAFRRVDLGSLT
ncbi:MAG: phage major capsid protein [Lysobacter sp.]|nr:phage major capsid protein [Lysobacter sp.]